MRITVTAVYLFPIVSTFALPTTTVAATLVDGDFSLWSFASTGTGGSDSASREPAGGNPDARLNITTTSPAGLRTVAGFRTDFSTSLAFEGDAFTLSLDVLGGPGAFGDGQAILLVVEQSGSIYWRGLGVTGVPATFTNKTFSSTFDQAQFVKLSGPGPATPVFTGGVVTRFGFGVQNSFSPTITIYYDNFNLLSALVPECPPTAVAIGLLGQNAVISWPQFTTNTAVLEFSSGISGPWSTNSQVPALIEGRFQVTNALIGSTKFYRLRCQ